MRSSDIGIEFPIVGSPGLDNVSTVTLTSNTLRVSSESNIKMKSTIIDLLRYTLSRSQLDSSSFDWDFFKDELDKIIQ